MNHNKDVMIVRDKKKILSLWVNADDCTKEKRKNIEALPQTLMIKGE